MQDRDSPLPPFEPRRSSEAPSAPALPDAAAPRDRVASMADASQGQLPRPSFDALAQTKDRGALYRLWTLLRVDPKVIAWGGVWQVLQAVSHIPFAAGLGYLIDRILPTRRLDLIGCYALANLALLPVHGAFALAAYVLVKFYGVIFLGRSREPSLAQAHDAGILERIGLTWLAALCVGLGLFPVVVLRATDRVNRSLLGATLGDHAASWWAVVPLAADRASYSPLTFGAGIALTITITFLLVRRFYHGRVRRSAAWDCGFPNQTPRMQDTAEGFGQPIRHIFGPFFRITRLLPTPFDTAPRYALQLFDRWWDWLYTPIERAVETGAHWVSFLQQGRISLYLMYSFVTLLILLAFVL